MTEDLENLAAEVGRLLRARGLTISCAESCTGGLLTSTLTDVPGSSRYLMGSVVSYTNEVKARILGVSEESLVTYGAVSTPVARAMAEGVRDLMRTDLGVGITGIAGPGGGTAEKPVGLVYIAVSAPRGTEVHAHRFSGARLENKCASVEHALRMIADMIRSSS
jgi:hypothetical protein